MGKKFSNKWKASRKKRKQVKYLANAPLHIKHKFISANLNKELRKKYSRRSFPLRKGDKVKVMRGKFKRKEGKIDNIDLKRGKVSVESLQIQKKDGTKISVKFYPSNLQIQELNLEDRKREKAIKRKLGGEKVEAGKKMGEKNPENKKFSGSQRN